VHDVAGDLPDFSYIEPCLILSHGDYHPAVSRALGHSVVLRIRSAKDTGLRNLPLPSSARQLKIEKRRG
jgi:hypothetical protein